MKDPVILIVDDLEDNLDVLKELLLDGFPNACVISAQSAKEGIGAADRSNLDIVLTDVHMPGTDGVQFCEHLKASEATAHIPVLLLTGHISTPEIIARGLNAGAFDFIPKPVDNMELIARVNAALRIKRMEDRLRERQAYLEKEIEAKTSDLVSANRRLRKEILERKETEKALQESNQRIIATIEGTDEGIWEMDITTGTLTLDANWVRILGYDAKNIQFDVDWMNRNIHPEDKLFFDQAWEHYLSGRETYFETEYRMKTRSGDWKWVWTRGVCVEYDSLEKPVRMIGTYRDITEKHKTDEILKRLMMAIEQVDDIVIITDRKGIIQYVNPAFERITGFSREEAVGRNPRILKSGIQNEDFYRKMWERLLAGEVWLGRIVNKRKDGGLYDEEAAITPVKNRLGEISNFIAVKRDITHQIQLEKQLKQAQKMESIGTLAGGIAHDFNNILFAIMGYNSLSMRNLPEDHPVRDHLLQLEKAANRARDLVSQILTFSRQTEYQLRPMMYQPVIKEALKMLRSSLPTTIDIVQEIEQDCGFIMGDPTQVHQVLMNLATNSYQAMREKGGTLTVSLKSVDLNTSTDVRYRNLKSGRYAELRVKDTGVGMEPKVLDRIFEPYFSTKDKGEGTGLGLSIVHGIVTSSGGDIFVESELGKGTEFLLLIPEVERSSTTPKATIGQEEELEGTDHIMVVDDEPAIVEMLENMLEELGYRVSGFASSKDALEAFSADSDTYDIVITDMTMPQMTGAELSKALLEIKPSLPIILCTGFSESIDEERAKKLGVREFLMKPVAFADLARVVKNANTVKEIR